MEPIDRIPITLVSLETMEDTEHPGAHVVYLNSRIEDGNLLDYIRLSDEETRYGPYWDYDDPSTEYYINQLDDYMEEHTQSFFESRGHKMHDRVYIRDVDSGQVVCMGAWNTWIRAWDLP